MDVGYIDDEVMRHGILYDLTVDIQAACGCTVHIHVERTRHRTKRHVNYVDKRS